MSLDKRVRRDEAAAQTVHAFAEAALRDSKAGSEPVDLRTGFTDAQRRRQSWRSDNRRTIESLVDRPFQAMMEVVAELRGPGGALEEKDQLWYASETSVTNEVFGAGSQRVNVLAWTHPGVQLALTTKLGEYADITSGGYRLAGLETKARARFDAVRPNVSGLYEPGGPVRPTAKSAPSVGLKAVKLSMTADQVNAFDSRMTGMMIVTGAPGGGKTTVAFQRIRFLLDQQNLRTESARSVPFTIDRTRVFLANLNLVAYSRKMLVDQLDIPDQVVTPVDPFISGLLDRYWAFTNEARPRQRRLQPIELQARRAYFGLCRAEMLAHLWRAYERQIGERFRNVSEALWENVSVGSAARPLSAAFAKALAACATRADDNGDPPSSRVRLDTVYEVVARQYEGFRQALGTASRNHFDDALRRALYHIYDPLSALAAAFAPRRMEGAERIARGTGHLAQEAVVLDSLAHDWVERRYGPEEHPWLAWLLRFALSEVDDTQGQGRFRTMQGSELGLTAFTGCGRAESMRAPDSEPGHGRLAS